MSSIISPYLPEDYPQRIKRVRGAKGLTQTQFAELVGVTYVTVNRWENGQSRPNKLAWRRIAEIETPPNHVMEGTDVEYDAGAVTPPSLDFSTDPNAVSAVAEAHRLAYGHLFNPAFATEMSLIDPLPH